MKKLYLTLVFSFILSIFCFADNFFHGYIITKNGKRLTGYFTEVIYTGYSSQVVFINDFGTSYEISPELIKAFVYRKKNDYLVYESKRLNTAWVFLKVIFKGDDLLLYRSPEYLTKFTVGYEKVEMQKFEANDFFIQKPGGKLKRLRKLNYRKRLRKLIRKRAPELAEKIGSKGYKFNNLFDIMLEYNEICERTKYKL
ncbi:MAG: hypothetical protein MK226_17010 [Saprospiraceae bacterium]|jgi:hypothetical protein|nr:hypothetical protein [Saprospiraceae bacterium]